MSTRVEKLDRRTIEAAPGRLFRRPRLRRRGHGEVPESGGRPVHRGSGTLSPRAGVCQQVARGRLIPTAILHGSCTDPARMWAAT